jgi:mRNA interferase RelE/StbE
MYTIEFLKPAAKDYKKLPQDVAERVDKALEELKKDPRPVNSKKLKTTDFYRIRVGDYRVMYEIQEGKLVILLLRIRHRREVYRNIH